MPRLETFELQIQTGAQGLPEPPQYSINGFTLDFDEAEGGAGPGQTLHAKAAPQSYPHSLLLLGPAEGAWSIESITATYHCAGEEPYVMRLGPVTLDDRSDLSIWYERPPRTIDV
jgi:hypothetical protein